MTTSIMWVSTPVGSGIEIPDNVASAIEREAARRGLSAVEVVRDLLTSFAEELNDVQPADGEQRATFVRELMTRGPVLVIVDPSARGVDVPPHLRGTDVQALRIGHGLTPPITDLLVDAYGVRASLMFDGARYFCQLPWRSVVAARLEFESTVTTPPAPVKPGRHLKLV